MIFLFTLKCKERRSFWHLFVLSFAQTENCNFFIWKMNRKRKRQFHIICYLQLVIFFTAARHSIFSSLLIVVWNCWATKNFITHNRVVCIRYFFVLSKKNRSHFRLVYRGKTYFCSCHGCQIFSGLKWIFSITFFEIRKFYPNQGWKLGEANIFEV